MIDRAYHILDAMTGGGPFNDETAKIELEAYVRERIAEATEQIRREAEDAAVSYRSQIIQRDVDITKMRNTIGWYQDRDTYSEGPPEEWRVW